MTSVFHFMFSGGSSKKKKKKKKKKKVKLENLYNSHIEGIAILHQYPKVWQVLPV